MATDPSTRRNCASCCWQRLASASLHRLAGSAARLRLAASRRGLGGSKAEEHGAAAVLELRQPLRRLVDLQGPARHAQAEKAQATRQSCKHGRAHGHPREALAEAELVHAAPFAGVRPRRHLDGKEDEPDHRRRGQQRCSACHARGQACCGKVPAHRLVAKHKAHEQDAEEDANEAGKADAPPEDVSTLHEPGAAQEQRDRQRREDDHRGLQAVEPRVLREEGHGGNGRGPPRSQTA
mmetsp:Transcript_72078/g.191534  ORF Transcript_72078/g.191534 Transcript_72078/m.191534 type:complete len:237 (+) Transcript_72078:124-834(+)